VLRASQTRLRSLVGSLSGADLRSQSYDTEWSIAQVLSHLGSQAEIFQMFLDFGLSGQQPPGNEAFPPVWDAWNNREPEQQAHDAVEANDRFVARLEGLSGEALGTPITVFGMDLLIGDLARLRVGEHAVHSWDIAVALEPTAVVAHDAVALLIDTLAMLAARAGKPQGLSFDLAVHTIAPDRNFLLSVGDGVELRPLAGEPSTGTLELPAEALVRLVYGRLDAAHTPPTALIAGEITLDDLRRIFPGV
jgi:uncharacterized protein (TIGR03083 family)